MLWTKRTGRDQSVKILSLDEEAVALPTVWSQTPSSVELIAAIIFFIFHLFSFHLILKFNQASSNTFLNAGKYAYPMPGNARISFSVCSANFSMLSMP